MSVARISRFLDQHKEIYSSTQPDNKDLAREIYSVKMTSIMSQEKKDQIVN